MGQEKENAYKITKWDSMIRGQSLPKAGEGGFLFLELGNHKVVQSSNTPPIVSLDPTRAVNCALKTAFPAVLIP